MFKFFALAWQPTRPFEFTAAVFDRLWWNIPRFADMDWYFASARQALVSGRMPLLGITASITWLHQGPLWTYLLLLPTALHFDPIWLTAGAATATIVLVYLTLGIIPALVLVIWPFALVAMLTPYHTALIPLFFFTSYACLISRRPFWAGLFVGFLYQSHLLTFIYWPLWLYLILKHRLRLFTFTIGSLLGVLPFIIAGPVQLLGIFVWIAKGMLVGFDISSGISTAYWIVLLPGLTLGLGWVLKWISAYRHSLGQKRGA